jgi:alpha-mannosidase
MRLALQVPAMLAADRQSRGAKEVSLFVVVRASVAAGVPRVDITVDVDNTACDHRLRVHFPVPLVPAAADYDGHFEVVSRPLGLPRFEETWIEQPRPEVPQREFTAVSDGRTGLMIANRGLPEVQVLAGAPGSTEIALTLLRCVGWLSRDDLTTRKQHTGPPHATPGAQMIGPHRFEYSIIPHSGDWRSAYDQACAFNAPLRTVATGRHGGPLPTAASLLHKEPAAFVISAIKTAEDGRGLVVRGYNTGAETLQAVLRPITGFTRAARMRMDETEEEELPITIHGDITLPVRGHEVVTVGFW